MSEFNFANVDAAKNLPRLAPGYYKLSISDVEYVKPDDGGKPRLTITFSGEDGSMNQSFFITPKALNRLQYLHEELFGKKCDKAFQNEDEIGAYFKRALTGKKVEKTYLVGGREATDGNIYAELPYAGFIMPDDMKPQLGAFDEGSALYRNNIRKSKDRDMMTSDDAVLPNSGGTSTGGGDFANDLPF